MSGPSAAAEARDRRARELLSRWQLRADGPPRHHDTSVTMPVRTAERVPAVLTVRDGDDDARHAHLVLRRWGGDGAARLLRADPHAGALLTERLHDRSLSGIDAAEACAVIAGLYPRLHSPAMPQLDSLRARLARDAEDLAALPRNSPIPHRLVEQAVAVARELAADDADEVVLHGDLHFDTVLAADREAWLAIAPRPLNGDPHWEIAPVLWSCWDSSGAQVREGLRRRFFAVVDAAGFDEDRARAATIVRVVRAAYLLIGTRSDSPTTELTRLLAVVKSVQD